MAIYVTVYVCVCVGVGVGVRVVCVHIVYSFLLLLCYWSLQHGYCSVKTCHLLCLSFLLHAAYASLLEEYHQKVSARGEVQRALDDAWKQNMLKKKERELEDVKHREAPSILLHQQCDRYKRCKQCKRRTNNVGESNVLAESRYISGARLMV